MVERGTKDGYSTATVEFLKDNLPEESDLEALQVCSKTNTNTNTNTNTITNTNINKKHEYKYKAFLALIPVM